GAARHTGEIGRISGRRGAGRLRGRREVAARAHARPGARGRRDGQPDVGRGRRTSVRRCERTTCRLRCRHHIADTPSSEPTTGENCRMTRFAVTAAAASLALTLAGTPAFATDITFYYPIAVGGPITKIVDRYVEEFHKSHPDITVKPVYTGSYQDSIVKAMTAAKAGNAPDVAVLLSTDMFTLIDNDLLVPWEQVANSDKDKAWIKSFYPAFMENSQAGGHTWGIPFQRSTIVQYWNKDAFKAA